MRGNGWRGGAWPGADPHRRQEGRLLPLASLAGDSGDQQNAGPYFLGKVVPVVDHHLEVGGWARKIAEDCTPICATVFRKGCFFRVIYRSLESYRGSLFVFYEPGRHTS